MIILLILAPINTAVLAKTEEPDLQAQSSEQQPLLTRVQQPEHDRATQQQPGATVTVQDERHHHQYGLDRQQQVNWVITRFLMFLGGSFILGGLVSIILKATHTA